MTRYADDSKQRVRDAVDFVQVVSARTELRRASPKSYTGLCPFHEERSPSFGIDPIEKLYYCFGCGKGGDVFSFVMETENISFPEALELLADRFGIELERVSEDPRAAQRRAQEKRLLALLERTAAYYVRMLWEAEEAAGAREYLASRGLDEGVLRGFRVGYSPAAWDRVVTGSRRAGFSAGELLAAGLAQRARGGSGLIDRFRGRLMFPLADAQGRVRGFGARALLPDDKPKYVNTSETDVYKKGRFLFGQDLARVEAAKAGRVILAEGYTDVVALHQAGFTNAVGAMGTSLTDAQANELLKMAGTVVLCLDSDAAGTAAAARSSEVTGAAWSGFDHFAKKLDLRVVELPAGSDPADFLLAAGADALRERLDEAIPFPAFQVKRALAGADSGGADARDRALAEVASVIRPLPQSVLRQELVQTAADRLGLSTQLVADALAADPAPAANGGATRSGAPRRALHHRDAAEHSFLALCLALPSEGRARLSTAEIDKLFSDSLTRRAAAIVRDHADAPAAALPPDDPDLARLVAELVMRAGEIAEQARPADLDRASLHLALARLDRQIGAARVEGTDPGPLAAERQTVLSELRKLVH